MINFDNWFNKTFDSKYYIPLIPKFLSNSNNRHIKVKRKVSKAIKFKKTGKKISLIKRKKLI